FAKLRKGKQLEVGYYNSDTKEGKNYDRCKNPEHQPCKCDFFYLSKICKKYNKSCERPFARISEDTEIAGLWE
ncbi:16432_t:CDS:2, partial [Dentiscutata heterogama]